MNLKPFACINSENSGFENPMEDFYKVFNEFIITFFFYSKFIFVFILFSLGILTLLKLRGTQVKNKAKGFNSEEGPIRKEILIVGFTYLFLGLGILFNYLIYFLIWALDPLPDRAIFRFLNFNSNFDPNYMNRVEDIEALKYPHEKTIYYCFALISFYAFFNLLISFWFLLNNRGAGTPRLTFFWLFKSIILGILFGFTTCLPFFL